MASKTNTITPELNIFNIEVVAAILAAGMVTGSVNTTVMLEKFTLMYMKLIGEEKNRK